MHMSYTINSSQQRLSPADHLYGEFEFVFVLVFCVPAHMVYAVTTTIVRCFLSKPIISLLSKNLQFFAFPSHLTYICMYVCVCINTHSCNHPLIVVHLTNQRRCANVACCSQLSFSLQILTVKMPTQYLQVQNMSNTKLK